MPKCPVCKTEWSKNSACEFCGFNDFNRVFINREDALQWEETILNPYRIKYQSSLSTNGILKINGNRLAKYYKSSKEPKIIVPDCVTSMAPKVFNFCETIKEVYLPDSLTEIPERAFIGCKSLEKVRLSENLSVIPRGAFSGCVNLKSIYIPEKVKSIHDEAFLYCHNLKEIIISPRNANVKNKDGFLISNGLLVKVIANPKILKNISIPEGVTTIESGSLAGFNNLVEIRLPETLEYIGLHSFYGFSKLKNIVIPKNVAHIGPNAFANCDSIEDIIVDDKNSNFSCSGNCIIEKGEIIQGFPSSVIPEDGTVSEIATYAFTNIKRDKPLRIPNSIKTIDARAFCGEFEILCEFEKKPTGWNPNWCEKFHKGNVFFLSHDGCKILANRDMIEGNL